MARLAALKAGEEFIKYDLGEKTTRVRVFYADHSFYWCTGSSNVKIPTQRILLRSLSDLLVGRQSQILQQSCAENSDAPEHQFMTIVYRLQKKINPNNLNPASNSNSIHLSSKTEQLNLQAHEPEIIDTWVEAIQQLISSPTENIDPPDLLRRVSQSAPSSLSRPLLTGSAAVSAMEAGGLFQLVALVDQDHPDKILNDYNSTLSDNEIDKLVVSVKSIFLFYRPANFETSNKSSNSTPATPVHKTSSSLTLPANVNGGPGNGNNNNNVINDPSAAPASENSSSGTNSLGTLYYYPQSSSDQVNTSSPNDMIPNCSSIPLSQVFQLFVGGQTPTLKAAARKTDLLTNELLAFSLILQNSLNPSNEINSNNSTPSPINSSTNNFKSIDLVAEASNLAVTFIHGINHLLTSAGKNIIVTMDQSYQQKSKEK